METIKIAIITKDQEYGKALSFGLLRIHKDFMITLYKSDQLHKVNDSKFDLIIKDFLEDQEQAGHVYLVEKPSMIKKDPENKSFHIYKYNNVRLLAGELLYIYSELTGRKALQIKKEDLNLISFGAAEGGAGCTSSALAFAQEVKRFQGRKVLYLSLEEIESTADYMEILPGSKGISEFIYALFDGQWDEEKAAAPFLESFITFDEYGVEAFVPSKGRNLLKTLSAEEVQNVISALMDLGRYNTIVIDVGSDLSESSLCCYEMSTKSCFVAKEKGSKFKEDHFFEYLLVRKGEKLLDSFIKVNNFFSGQEADAAEEKQEEAGQGSDILETVCNLQQDPSSFRMENGYKKISIDRAFGVGVKEMAAALMDG